MKNLWSLIFRSKTQPSSHLKNKILVIAPQPFLQWRGTPIRVFFTLVSLSKLGYKIDLLTLPFGQSIEIDGVSVIRVSNPFKISNVKIGPSAAKIFFDFLVFIKGLSLVRKSKYTIIHGIEEAGTMALILASLTGVKSIYEKHSDVVSYKNGFFKNLLLRTFSLIEKIVIQRVDMIICTGVGLEELVKRVSGSRPVFHIADVPSSLVEPTMKDVLKTRNKLLDNQDDLIVTYVGSFAIYQGISLLKKAIYHVLKNSSKVRFLIVGGTPNEILEFKNEPFLQEYSNSFLFMGILQPDEIPVLLKASDILLSLRMAGVNTPLKLLDYLKSGKPVVATDVKANRLILNEKCAIFAQSDPDDIASAIINLVEHPEMRYEMGVEAEKLFSENYSFQRFTLQIGQCYQKALDS